MPRQCLVTSCQWSLLASLYMAHVLYFELKFFWVFSTAKKVALKTLCPKSFFISLHRFSKVSFLLFLVYFKNGAFKRWWLLGTPLCSRVHLVFLEWMWLCTELCCLGSCSVADGSGHSPAAVLYRGNGETIETSGSRV